MKRDVVSGTEVSSTLSGPGNAILDISAQIPLKTYFTDVCSTLYVQTRDACNLAGIIRVSYLSP